MDAVTSKPIQRIAWQVGAISAKITLQIRTGTVRRAWGDASSLSWICIGQCNEHATSEPWLGKYCLGWGAIRNLVIGDAQDAQRRMLIINIKMIELY